jgi:hypothetical protein
MQIGAGAMAGQAISLFAKPLKPNLRRRTVDDKDTALKLALEALGLYQAAGFGDSTDFNKQHEAFYKAQTAITAIKQALAQQVQEPAGHVVSASLDHAVIEWSKQTSTKGGGDPRNAWSWPVGGEAVYLAPPAAPVQELQRYSPNGEGGMEVDSLGAYVKHQDVTAPPAAPEEPVYHLRQFGDVTKEQLDRYMATGDINPKPVPVQETEVSWGVDWGRVGDKSCAMIIKRLPDGKIEVVAVEYEP